MIDGVIQKVTSAGRAKLVTQRELNNTLARRTYDESGDYIVKTFAPVIEGKTTANSTNSAETDTFVLSIGQGKAYVRGSEAEVAKPRRKVVKKGRETANVENRAKTQWDMLVVTRPNCVGW